METIKLRDEFIKLGQALKAALYFRWSITLAFQHCEIFAEMASLFTHYAWYLHLRNSESSLQGIL